jgi:arginyl-tRNA synthetase
LIRETVERANAIGKEKDPSLDDTTRQAISRAIAVGAIKFPMLARDNAKIATFDWESALDFNGQAAPYIQYAHVRANSILRRMEGNLPAPAAPAHTLEPTEVQLIDLMSRLPNEVQRAAAEYRPLQITNLAYEMAKAFTDFYNACTVHKAEPAVRDFRLRLVAAARQSLANALNMLGIAAPDIM